MDSDRLSRLILSGRDLANTGVRDWCQQCDHHAMLWRTQFGVDLRRWCLVCWAQSLGLDVVLHERAEAAYPPLQQASAEGAE